MYSIEFLFFLYGLYAGHAMHESSLTHRAVLLDIIGNEYHDRIRRYTVRFNHLTDIDVCQICLTQILAMIIIVIASDLLSHQVLILIAQLLPVIVRQLLRRCQSHTDYHADEALLFNVLFLCHSLSPCHIKYMHFWSVSQNG